MGSTPAYAHGIVGAGIHGLSVSHSPFPWT
jgi:hypothetical protein